MTAAIPATIAGTLDQADRALDAHNWQAATAALVQALHLLADAIHVQPGKVSARRSVDPDCGAVRAPARGG